MTALEGYSELIKIGEGGMATVYRGIQDSLRRPVAIKLLINELSADSEARNRFERESYIVARLNHANIIHVIDRGLTEDDKPYFVMEYVEGVDLSTASKSGSLSHNDKIDIVVQLLKALSYAHRNNVIHRDIKPDNILIDNEGTVKVLDFGIAQFYDDFGEQEEQTDTGTVMGTYSYMSPEQRDAAENVTAQSDLYSVGVVMYKLFTGKLPNGVFPEPYTLNPELNQEISDLIMSCLNTEPGLRPLSAEQFKTDLLTAAQGAHLNTEIKQRVDKGITRFKSRFMLLDVLREDRFGGVYLYQQKAKSTLLVIKKKLVDEQAYQASNILASLEHPNIVNTLGMTRNEDFFILVQEYMSGGTLQDKLAFQLNWQQTLKIAAELCTAMIFAHQNRVVHGHLRPTNILFNSEGVLKVTDFSLHDDVSDVEAAHFYSLQGESRSIAADIYAVGVILYQLFTGCLPRRRDESGFFVRKGFSRLPSDIQELITKMLSTIPENREQKSLEKAIAIFAAHQRSKANKSFTDHALHDKNRESERRKSDRKENRDANPAAVDVNLLAEKNKSKKSGRPLFLFAILVLVYAQYFFIFDGQQKINQLIPALYSDVLDEFQGLTGRQDARGTTQIENRRMH